MAEQRKNMDYLRDWLPDRDLAKILQKMSARVKEENITPNVFDENMASGIVQAILGNKSLMTADDEQIVEAGVNSLRSIVNTTI